MRPQNPSNVEHLQQALMGFVYIQLVALVVTLFLLNPLVYPDLDKLRVSNRWRHFTPLLFMGLVLGGIYQQFCHRLCQQRKSEEVWTRRCQIIKWLTVPAVMTPFMVVGYRCLR